MLWHAVGSGVKEVTAFPKQNGQVLLSVFKRHIGYDKANSWRRVGFDEVAHAAAEDGPDQDIHIENNHLNASWFFCAASP